MALRSALACIALSSSVPAAFGGSPAFLEPTAAKVVNGTLVVAANATAPAVLNLSAVESAAADALGNGTVLKASCSCCHHEEKISDVWKSCRAEENRRCSSCSLYHAVSTHPKCGGGVAIVGEKICPVAALGGNEGITKKTAAAFQNVWDCAAQKTGSAANFALITNPWKARTQHHLHVKTMPLDSRGAKLQKRLEKITKCKTGKWHYAGFKCKYSRVQLFSSMPNVYEEVLAYASTGKLGRMRVNPDGEMTLANVGITVLFICDGKPAVLAHSDGHGYCSIEHSIYGER